jgi:hypothetical protein
MEQSLDSEVDQNDQNDRISLMCDDNPIQIDINQLPNIFDVKIFIYLVKRSLISELLIWINQFDTFELKLEWNDFHSWNDIKLILKCESLIIALIDKNVSIYNFNIKIQWIHVICEYSTPGVLDYYWLKYHPDLNEPNELGQTPIHLVCGYSQNPQMITYLLDLDLNLDVNTPDLYGNKPIHLIFWFNSLNIDLIKRIASRTNDLDIGDNFKWKPIHWACWNSTPEVIQLLIDMGVKLKWDTIFSQINEQLKAKINNWEMCVKFIESDGEFIQSIPQRFLNNELYHLAYRTSPTETCAALIPPSILSTIKPHGSHTKPGFRQDYDDVFD